MQILKNTVAEQSTCVVQCDFCDIDNAPITPKSVSWTLFDKQKNVINNRQNVSITPAQSVKIVLTGDDLKYTDGAHRILQIKAVYDSNYGTDLTLIDEALITIEDLKTI
jgi:hypothetical protein